jgi:hypothetical protein
MGRTKVIRAVETVRRIRDRQARQLAGKSAEQVMRFFNEAAERARQAVARRASASGHTAKCA